MKSKSRSYKKIRKWDLRRLAAIAREDREDLFSRKADLGKIYRKRVICVALCQGAALHYIDGKNGVKDFDVWTFFREHPKKPFPYRRIARRDFGNSRFGRAPGKTHFKGRCVDLIGRSIPSKKAAAPIQAVQDYLKLSKNKTARSLAEKAIIILEPEEFIGTVAWPMALARGKPCSI